jgi:hypothetical protein
MVRSATTCCVQMKPLGHQYSLSEYFCMLVLPEDREVGAYQVVSNDCWSLRAAKDRFDDIRCKKRKVQELGDRTDFHSFSRCKLGHRHAASYEFFKPYVGARYCLDQGRVGPRAPGGRGSFQDQSGLDAHGV